MTLKTASTDILLQLADVVSQLSNADYARPLTVLSGNTIGKHVRHILEFYELLLTCQQTGCLNYDCRRRDLRLETDPLETLSRIGQIDRAIQQLDLSQPLRLEANLSASLPGHDGPGHIGLATSVERELLYNIEHGIHHMALIQVGLRAEFGQIRLPDHFGVAYSTLQHQQQAA